MATRGDFGWRILVRPTAVCTLKTQRKKFDFDYRCPNTLFLEEAHAFLSFLVNVIKALNTKFSERRRPSNRCGGLNFH